METGFGRSARFNHRTRALMWRYGRGLFWFWAFIYQGRCVEAELLLDTAWLHFIIKI
jgi:hypothetical protein